MCEEATYLDWHAENFSKISNCSLSVRTLDSRSFQDIPKIKQDNIVGIYSKA